MLYLTDEIIDCRSGIDRARILARDAVRRLEHQGRGKVAVCYKNDRFSVETTALSMAATLSGTRLAIQVRPRLRGLHLLLVKGLVTARVVAAFEDIRRPYSHYPGRVFCIGFQKTGTTSLNAALGALGVFGLHDAPWLLEDVVRGVWDSSVFDEYQAFSDNPFPPMFKELDQRFPGSKFILTLRNTETWLASVRSLVAKFPGMPMEKWLYGTREFSETIFRERFERHNADVQAYFKDRPADCLVLDLRRGDGWDKLCPFLGLPVPDRHFPHANARGTSA